ncbi:AAA+ family ATPase [Defluviimonas sp. WL0075]|uniref:AAA+ family ATPase n=1 Tax=Albidovulum sediminicola TaxID=2984331 RepID=A0ABT2Z5U0_9RHOB|nr:AAA+ family ATPase [Defluviimonas sp. WL0075]MCV2866481.1 AAA+ family ATPase [Defluviimonas sp. WL0075]
MKALTTALAIALAFPAVAGTEEEGAEQQGADQGFSLLEEGARIIMRSMLDDIGPKLDEMRDGLEGAMAEIEPHLAELMDMIGDLQNYHAPEKLPNGDIILRRKVPEMPIETGPNGEIEI